MLPQCGSHDTLTNTMADSVAATSFLTNGGGGGPDDDVTAGMIVVGIVLLFLLCMVILRYGCNMLIDIFVLRDGDSLMRTFSELRRFFCPCWHPRTEPTAVGVDGGAGSAGGDNNGGTVELINMETLLTGLTQKQKQELLASVVPSKTATKQDIKQWKQQSGILSDACLSDSSNEFVKKASSRNRSKTQKTASKVSRQDGVNSGGGGGHGGDEYCSGSEKDNMKRSRQSTTPKSHECSDFDVEEQHRQAQQQHCHTALICPICIHDIEKGHQVCYSGFCHHLFHRDCLSAWLSTHARICPYCRGEIITQEMLNEAYRCKLAQQETVGWDEEDDEDDDDHDHDSGDDDDGDSSVGSFSRYRP